MTSIIDRKTLFTFVFIGVFAAGCSRYAPDHIFGKVIAHDYAAGSITQDSLAMEEILSMLQLSGVQASEIARYNAAERVCELWLDGRSLDSLPAAIGRLLALEELYARNNNIVSLPLSIGALEKLEILNLYGNKLSALPDEITALSLFYEEEVCSGPCGGPDCCTDVMFNGLFLDSNMLCDVPAHIGAWIDVHDTTWREAQRCNTP